MREPEEILAAAARLLEPSGRLAGKRVVVPGSDNKVLSFLPRLLPRGWVLSLTKGGKI